MPSLVTSPSRVLEHLNMDTTDNRNKPQGKLTPQLHWRCMQSFNTEKLCLEEMAQWSVSLERLLASKYGVMTFQAFLKSEFSDENIDFWLVCEEYKKIKSSFKMSSRAKKIFKRYIQTEAPREINIDHKTREIIRRNMTTPTTVCFNEAQRIVYALMERDSYPRFLRSDIYRTLLESTSPHIRLYKTNASPEANVKD